jgi:hypothetical protein
MFTRATLIQHFALAAFCAASLFGQQKPAPSSSSGAREFPVALQQNVAAGKTPVGTKIQAKLIVATLVDGTVIPRNAVFSGEVTESVAKTATDPSRLAIRMDSVQWKNGSAPLKVYLTAWYYPTVIETGQALHGPAESTLRTWNGAGAYPDPSATTYKPFPGTDLDNRSDTAPDTPATVTSPHRVLMKDVQSVRNSDGAIGIASRQSNIKLDKLTTYVLAAGDLLPAK